MTVIVWLAGFLLVAGSVYAVIAWANRDNKTF